MIIEASNYISHLLYDYAGQNIMSSTLPTNLEEIYKRKKIC